MAGEKGFKDSILFIGLALYATYTIVNRFFIEIPDILAYPWMILSCICMLAGIYRSARYTKNRKGESD